jgi:N-acetylneuraminic acid mutarotase
MPTNRTQLASATVTNGAGQSVVYAIGGLNANGGPITNVTAYNVATNAWTSRQWLPRPLAATNGAGVINGKIYVTGGYSDYDQLHWSLQLYVYDPTTNTWTLKREMPTVTDQYGVRQYPAGYGVTGVIGGKLYVVSGSFVADPPHGVFESYGSLFLRYNPGTDQWVRLPDPFIEPTLRPSIGGVIDGKFYVMAQLADDPGHQARFAVYDPATNKWTTRTPLGLSRPGAASAVLDGKLYVMGGQRYNAAHDKWDTLAITVVYDPATNRWTPQASLPSPRTDISATKVFLAGQPRIEVVGGLFADNNVQYVP